MPQFKRAYEVERVDKHTIVEQVAQFEDTGDKDKRGRSVLRYIGFKTEKREVEDGYMVYFPPRDPSLKGHSIYVENDDGLARLHFKEDGGLVDMETGLPHVPDAQPASLKDAAARDDTTRSVDDVIKALE